MKYGLSVTGIVDPKRIFTNVGCRPGDVLILTKPLGVGIVCSADRVGEASASAMEAAIRSMTTLNKYAAEVVRRFPVHACTDVTGFGFLGHLHEMLGSGTTAVIYSDQIPHIRKHCTMRRSLITGAASTQGIS